MHDPLDTGAADEPAVGPQPEPVETNPAEAAGSATGRRRFLGPGTMGLAVYGALAAGLALAIGADATLGTVAITIAVLVEIVAFYAAHVYADTLGQRYDRPGIGLSRRLTYACRHDLALVIGGLPLVLIFLLERVAGVDSDKSVTIALIALAVLLGGYGWAAARRSRASRLTAFGEGAIAAVLGIGILVLKMLLH